MDVLNNLAQASTVVVGVGRIHHIGSIIKLHLGCKVLGGKSYGLQATGYRLQAICYGLWDTGYVSG